MARDDLRSLARLYGVQTVYWGIDGKRHDAADEALLGTLRALGAELAEPEDAPRAARCRRQELWRTVLEPVTVAWQGEKAAATLRLPADKAEGAYRLRLELEDGQVRQSEGRLRDLAALRRRTVERAGYVRKALPLPEALPAGYHRLELAAGDAAFRSLVIAAPERAHAAPENRAWGLFLPLYALRTDRSWAAGDLSDLGTLMDWTARHGGQVVATLPLLGHLWEIGADRSPYYPATRLFFDELYLDVTKVTGFERCREARELLDSPAGRAALRRMRAAKMVEYRAQAELKGKVLAALAEAFFDSGADRGELERFASDNGDAVQYARFRAVCVRRGKGWPTWPQRLREGDLRTVDYDEADFRRFLFAQWQLGRQLGELSERARRAGVRWYLDLPLGCDPGGFDGWRWPEAFAEGMSVGSPPDDFQPGGQDWGFAPLHPRRLRDSGYAYFIRALRCQLARAGMLRIDHVMGICRLYWIARGAPAGSGLYVRYPMDELAAILCLESHRHEAVIVGEDLGTVPDAVRRCLRKRRIMGMYVLPFELRPQPLEEKPDEQAKAQDAAKAESAEAPPPRQPPPPPLREPPEDVAVSLNTHDLPTFAAFWSGADVDAQASRLDDEQADEQDDEQCRRRRALRAALLQAVADDAGEAPDGDDARAVLAACLRLLARSPGRLLLVNLEDLWLERRQQNRPGCDDRSNWRRKARHSLEELDGLAGVAGILADVAELRRAARR